MWCIDNKHKNKKEMKNCLKFKYFLNKKDFKNISYDLLKNFLKIFLRHQFKKYFLLRNHSINDISCGS